MKMAGLLREEADSYDTLVCTLYDLRFIIFLFMILSNQQSKLSETLKTIQLLEKKLRKDSQSELEICCRWVDVCLSTCVSR